jgi:hypothetical protein
MIAARSRCLNVPTMASWREFEERAPELAAFAHERLNDGVAYLATVRADGSPRVHPVTPLIRHGALFVRMYPSSPKGADLRRDGRYAMHSAVADTDGTGGELAIAGNARQVQDAEVIDRVMRGLSGTPDRYVLFEFEIDEAMSTVYEDDRDVRRRWRATDARRESGSP